MSMIWYFLLAVPLWLSLRSRKGNPKGLPSPPGPKGWPIVGCLSLPPGKLWLGFDVWLKHYGDIISFKIMGQNFVVLGSSSRTDDIFGTRSSIYSDRQRLPLLVDIVKVGYNFLLESYGPRLRKQRRSFQNHFHPNVIKRYHPIQLREARALLRNLLEGPKLFRRHLRFYFAAIIMGTVFDAPIQRLDDPYLVKVEEVMESFTQAGNFGRFWIDYFPFLIPFMEYVPSWVPGAGYKIRAERWREAGRFVEYSAFEEVKKDLANGINRQCVSASLLKSIADLNESERAEAEDIARSVSATAYIGGADTTLSSALTFFYAMAKHPEIQKKAQAEIDKVVGLGRLPDYSDKESLPYIIAILKEVTRWKPVVPSMGHMAGEDDEYDGYFIPKGTIVIGNSWSILYDPVIYPEPDKFYPERFLKNGDREPAPDPISVFGYGRRICPGRFFSNDSLFIVIASVLAAFDLSTPKDNGGKPINIEVEYLDGLVSQPADFQCIIKPRSMTAEDLIGAPGVGYDD